MTGKVLLARAALCLPAAALMLRGAEAPSWLAGARGLDAAVSAWAALGLAGLVWTGTVFRALCRVVANLPEPTARVGLVLVLALHLAALFAPLLATGDPGHLGDTVQERYLPPSLDHWMGTDILGRDLYTRVLYGARVSLAIATVSVVLSVILGVTVGAGAGWFGGWVDGALMRVTDLFLAFPRIFLILLLAALVVPGPLWIVLLLGVTGWMGIARLVRGSVLQLKETEYVLAARAVGLTDLRILARHVLPGALAPIVAAAALRVGSTILTESFLSFLGLGITDPDVSWGMLIRGGRHTMLDAWWVSTFPGIAIVLTVVGYNLLGDGLRDAYDRRLGELAPRED